MSALLRAFWSVWSRPFGLVFLLIWLAACGWGSSSADNSQTANPNAPPRPLTVDSALVQSGVAPADQGEDEAYHTTWVGTYLSEEPAKRGADVFRNLGLTAFTVRKTLIEKKGLLFPSRKPVGDFYLVNVGLFGTITEAEILGRRLKAQGRITNWQPIGSADPGEMARARIQTAPLEREAVKVTVQAQKKSGQPLPASAPAATGQGFKKMVHGRYVGSFKDLYAARAEAERLTAAGWPAAVERTSPGGGNWFRVFLTEAVDHRDFEAEPRQLAAARIQAASHGGIIFLVDLSGVAGQWGQTVPGQARTEASACAGYSRTGRVLTGLERVVGQMPSDSSQMVLVKGVTYFPPAGMVERVVRPVRTWWTEDESELTDTQNAYGPTLFNRPQVMRGLKNLKAEPNAVPLGPAFDSLRELTAMPGRKTLLVWSDFRWTGPDTETMGAAGRLKGQYGDQLDIIVIYGDADDKGWQLAENLARSGSGDAAWDGCRILADQSYYQSFIRRVFRARS